MKTNLEAIQAVISELGLTVESVFIPFSQSRNKAEKHRSLNWKVTLKCNGEEVLTCDYSAGIGSCPSYRQWGDNRLADQETEYGRACDLNGRFGQPIEPDSLDVIGRIFADCDIFDSYSGFEDWADCLGFNSDSIKAKAIFDLCVNHAMAFRSAIGPEGLNRLREVFQDY